VSAADLDNIRRTLAQTVPVAITGRVVRAAGVIVEAALPRVALGTQVEIRIEGGPPLLAEVVGVHGGNALLLPFGELRGVGEGCPVVPRASLAEVPVGDALLGRVVDPLLRPLDGGPAMVLRKRVPLNAIPPPAMQRRRISRAFTTGVRAIDGCLTLGEGQRVAIMAGPGVGKSVLLGMLAREADADVVVVGLIGERGREVREFVERDLASGLARAVVVVATGDEPPLLRVRAATAATAVAEHFRAQGKRVLLLVDSLSRVAMAQREVGLAAGEPPTSKGYPPSVFAQLPRLVERAGNDSGEGSITALYTVLAEGDDLTDPVADAVRAALDGHLVLSRSMAESGHFPAIDVLQSVSRVMSDVTAPEHLGAARLMRELMAAHRQASDLIDVGAYAPGANPRVDRALRVLPAVRRFLRQAPADPRTDVRSTVTALRAALEMKEGENV
jgi:flagellum-specific ATP synthase